MERPEEFVERYVALWNEPDADARARAVRVLWSEGGTQLVAAPEAMIEAAAALGFPTVTLEVRGHDQLEQRVATAYASFVEPGEHRFRPRGRVTRMGSVLKFGWEMVTVADGQPAGSGTDVVFLDHTDRIVTDYLFVD